MELSILELLEFETVFRKRRIKVIDECKRAILDTDMGGDMSGDFSWGLIEEKLEALKRD